MKKAAVVRDLVIAAKTKGAKIEDNDLITEVMAKCGFRRQLARAYIHNNWAKVQTKGEADKAAAARDRKNAARRAARAAAKAKAATTEVAPA